MIELKITIEDQGDGKLDIRHSGKDVGGATDMEVEAAEIVKQLLRAGMSGGALGQPMKEHLSPSIILDPTATPKNPHGKS